MNPNDTRGRPDEGEEPQKRKNSEEYNLENSTVVVEDGPTLIARIERAGSVEWGILAEATAEALSEVTG